MRINKLLYKGSITLLSGLAIVAAGCDNIDEDDRLIDYPLPEASKNELIMEFTGQKCSNCPDGARVIHELQDSYPENIIAVCLHPYGPEYTNPLRGGDVGLRSDIATEVYSYYRPASFPFAIFDGEIYDQSKSYLQWSSKASELISVATPVVLSGSAKYDSQRHITVEAKAEFVSGNYSGPLNIAVWIMENGIVGPQTTTSGIQKEYVHNHVLRGSLNGTWGEQLGASFDFEEVKEYMVTLEDTAESWKFENCQIVVFLCDPDSKKVIQSMVTDLEPEE